MLLRLPNHIIRYGGSTLHQQTVSTTSTLTTSFPNSHSSMDSISCKRRLSSHRLNHSGLSLHSIPSPMFIGGYYNNNNNNNNNKNFQMGASHSLFLVGGRRGLSWVNQFNTNKTMPFQFDWKKSKRYDWNTIREEIFAKVPKAHSLDGSLEGTSKGDLREKQKRTWLPPPDGFPETEEVLEDPIPPFRAVIESPTHSKKLVDPKPPQIPRVRASPDGLTHQGSGKRKASSAGVFLKPGNGLIFVNGRPIHEYFQQPRARDMALQPLVVSQKIGFFDIKVQVHGGGTYGQAGAVSLAIARALTSYEPSQKILLRATGHLIRDARVVERKKIGKKKARRAKQWSKR